MSGIRGPETDRLSFAERRDLDTEPWVPSWQRDGTPPDLPEILSPAAEIREVRIGEIDIVSGRLAIANAIEFFGAAVVDAAFAMGTWSVSVAAVIEPDGTEVVLAHILRHENQTQPRGWTVAARHGRVPLLSGSVVVGDGNAAAVIGTDDPDQQQELLSALFSPWSRYHQPKRKLQLPESLTALLTPEATARSYRLDLDERAIRSRVTTQPVFPRLWLGRASAGGEVVEVVIDCLVAAEGHRYTEVSDAWAIPVTGPGGRLTEGLRTDTRTASVFSNAFTNDGEDFQGVLLHVGSVHLAGHLSACDPVTRNAISLPVDAPAGDYPVFTVIGDFADIILVRLSATAPSSWHEWAGSANEGAMIPIDSGTYALLSRRVLDVASADPHLAADLAATSRGGTPGVFDLGPGLGGAVVNGWLGGDMPAWVLLGMDGDQRVSAIAIALVNDYELGNMPSEHDRTIFEDLQNAATSLGSDEDFADVWDDIQTSLQEREGRFSRQVRADAYNLIHSIDLEPGTSGAGD